MGSVPAAHGCQHPSPGWRDGSLLLALGLLATAAGASAPATPAFPPRLEQYLANSVKLTQEQRKSLVAGSPVTQLLDVDASQEVSVFGAVWIDAPVQRYVEAVQDIETLERGGGFKVTRRISAPPRLDDFADLHLREKDQKDLRTCRVGDCVVKLGAEAIQTLRSEIDWKAPGAPAAVDNLMRQFALLYVNAYLEGGNERLPVYRDRARPTFVAEAFRAMVDRMPELTTYVPDVRRYLLDYPEPTAPDVPSFLYWQETEFGLRPTIRISHVAVLENAEGTVVASKMIYATHYFWTGLELRVLLPDASRGPGFWFVTVNRSRSDGLSGFTGLLIRGRVRGAVRDGALAGLRATKRKLEAPLE